MKTLIRSFAIWLFFCTIALSTLQAQTIYSTSAGGNWNDTLTWVGHDVPQSNNPVVINGPVTVDANYWYTACGGLTINLGGSLAQGVASSDQLRIFGSVTNYGTIVGSNLRIQVRGNLMNYGSIDIFQIDFSGPVDKNLYSNSVLQVEQLYLSDTSDVILLSDITLDSTNCSFVSLQNGLNIGTYSLSINAGGFSGRMFSNGGVLTLTPFSRLNYATIVGDVEFNGHVKLNGQCYFYGDVTNNGILTNYEGITDYQCFYGNLINHGIIDDFGGYNFYINLKKDLINSGSLLNEQVHFSGNTKHQISSTTALNMVACYMTGPDTLQLLSNLSFIGTTLNFYTISRLDLNGYELKLNEAFINGTVEGNGGTIWFSGNSTTHSTYYYGPLNIKGTCQLSGGGVYFYDEIFVLDTLLSNVSYGTEIIVNGPLFNYGHIINGTTSLQISLKDALVNEGEISCYLLRFSGTNLQSINTLLPIECEIIYLQNSSGISAEGQLLLEGGTFSGNNNPVFLSHSGLQADEMTLISTYFYNDTIVPILLINGGHVQSCRFYGDVNLEGTLSIYGDGTHFYGTLFNMGTITKLPAYYGYEIEFIGPVINYGLITDGGLFIKAYDDVHNSGTWNNYQLTFSGLGEQKLKTDSAIQIQNVYSNDTTGFILADGSLLFEGSNISLNHEELYLNGNRLNLSGGAIGNVIIKAGQGMIRLMNDAYVYQTKFYEDTYLEGTFKISGDGCEFYGKTFVSDTLTKVDSYYGYTAYFYNQLINNGLITSGNLYINAYEDILNNGIWNNYQINMAGSGEQTIITHTPITTSSFYSNDTTGYLVAGGNLLFENCMLNLNEEQLNLAGNELKLINSTIHNSKVMAQDGGLRMAGESYMANCDFYTGIELFGHVRSSGNDNHFYGPVTVKDSLNQMPSYWGETLYFHGPLSNLGFVLGGNLYIESYSDISNEGIWSNYQILIKGTSNQNIQLINDAEITSQLLLYAMIPNASSYTWYKNGQSLVGQSTAQFANFQSNYMYSTDTVDATYAGAYFCLTNLGESRLISIQNVYQQLSVDLGAPIEMCEGDSVLLSPQVSFGSSPYSYLWSNGASGSSIYAVAGTASIFSVTVTDALNQAASDTVFVTAFPLPSIDLPSDTFGCESLMLFVPIFDATFQWSNGQIMNHILVQNTGLYSVTVTSQQNCVATDQVYVELFDAPEVNLGQDQILPAGTTIVLNAGFGMSSYLWSTGATTQTISVVESGTYWVSISAQGNCSAYDEVVITFEYLPDLGESCLNPYLYGTVNNPAVTGLTEAAFDSDWWSFTVSDTAYAIEVGLCGSSFDTRVEVFASCFGDNIAYNDDGCGLGSKVLLDTLTPGTYFVKVYGYSYHYGAYTLEIKTFECDSLDLNGGAFAQNCGYIELGQAEVYADAGMYPYEYSWSNGGIEHFIFDSAGVYTVTVTDAWGCSETKTFVIPLSHVLDLDLGPDLSALQGSTVELSTLPNMQLYYWSTSETTQSIFVNQTGTYLVDIMDTLGCYASDQITVTFDASPNPIDIYLAPDDTICAGDEVLLSATISGGNAPFSFLWSNGETTDYLWVSPQTTASYSLTVTSGSGLTDSDEITIYVAASPLVDIIGETVACEGTIKMLQVSSPGTYNWSTGASTSQIFVSASGSYAVTVTNSNGCSASAEHNISFFTLPIVDLGPDLTACAGDVLILEAPSGLSYYWSTGSVNPYLNVTHSGIYSVSVTDLNGCSASDQISVAFNPLPAVSIGPDLSIPAGSSVVLSAGTSFSTYLWSNGSTESSIEVSVAGTYSVEVSDATGCYNSDEMVLTTYQINPSPGWSYSNTGIMHTILIPDTCLITMDGTPIASGDFIGVFYDDNGTMECGGYVMWNGQVTALTAWGDDSMTQDKDGFAEGEEFTFIIWASSTGTFWDPQPGYMPLTVMPNQGEYAVNGLSGLLSLVATSIDYQYINLPVNWSYFSTYIDLFEPNIADLLDPILVSVIIAKNSGGQTFWPQYGLNMIGNLELGRGYQIKLSTAAVLECAGDAVTPENYPISLPASWSIMAYLRQNQASVVALMAPIVNDLTILKDSWGNTYWPQWSLNTIGNLKPGEGYLVKMASPVLYTYPANNQSLKVEHLHVSNPVYFQPAFNSNGQMTLCIPDFAWVQSPDYGDEIAALNNQGKVVGAAVYQGAATGITIWEKDELDSHSKGLNVGEKYELVLWKKAQNQVFKLHNVIYLEGSDVYETNAMAVVAEVGIEQSHSELNTPVLYPNPANERIMIQYETLGGATLNLFNQLGELLQIQEIAEGTTESTVDVKNLPAGLYWIRLMNSKQSFTLPLEIVH